MKAFLVILLCLACATPARAGLVDRPHLSITRTILDPGQVTTVWTGLYADTIEKHVVELRAQSGLIVEVAEQDAFLDGEHGQIISWRVTASTPLRPGRYWMWLYVDGVYMDTIAVDVRPSCCWIWLPWVRKE